MDNKIKISKYKGNEKRFFVVFITALLLQLASLAIYMLSFLEIMDRMQTIAEKVSMVLFILGCIMSGMLGLFSRSSWVVSESVISSREEKERIWQLCEELLDEE